MKKILFGFSIVLLLTIASPARTSSSSSIPSVVKSYLDKTYSGWSFSTSSKYCNSARTNGEIQGDFDGNGQTDYAVKIRRGTKGYVIAFVSKGSTYTPTLLENKSASDIEDTALNVMNGKIHVANCETSSYYYVYRKGKFSRQFTSD